MFYCSGCGALQTGIRIAGRSAPTTPHALKDWFYLIVFEHLECILQTNDWHMQIFTRVEKRDELPKCTESNIGTQTPIISFLLELYPRLA